MQKIAILKTKNILNSKNLLFLWYIPVSLKEKEPLLFNRYNWNLYKNRITIGNKTEKMKDILILGWIVGLFQQLPFIVIIISIFLVALIYRKYNPDTRYYEYIIKRQEDLINTFYVLYQQISKRDLITKNLLLVAKNEQKID